MPEIVLYQFPAPWDVSSASCFCAKLEAFLRWKGLPYRTVSGLSLKGVPKGKVPYIEFEGRKIGDSDLIIRDLCESKGLDAYPGLPDEKRAVGRAVHYLCEEGIYRAMSYFRFVDDAGWKVICETFFAKYPRWAMPLVEWKVRKYVAQQLMQHGIGRHSAQEVAAAGVRDISALSAMLGDDDFFFGDEMTLIDLTVYSVVANLVVPPFTHPLAVHARGQANLMRHMKRVRAACFGGGA